MKIIARTLVVVSLLLIFGCSQKTENKEIDDYKYAVILSNQSKNGVLQLYDSKGVYLGNKKIKASGIDENGGTYLNGPQFKNDRWYIGVSPDSKKQNFILELDPESLEIENIPANVGDDYQYTGYYIDEDFVYTYYTAPNIGTHIVQTNLTDNKIVNETEIKNTFLIHILNYGEKLIFISDSIEEEREKGLQIKVVNKKTLAIEAKFNNPDYFFTKDAQLVGNQLYMVPSTDKLNMPTDQLIIFNLEDASWKEVKLPIKSSRFLKLVNDKLYAIEQKVDSDHNTVAIIDLNTIRIEKTIEFDYRPRDFVFDESHMISSSDQKVYIYDIETFELLDQFEIKDADDWMFGSLLMKFNK